jgi:hypothetical protein
MHHPRPFSWAEANIALSGSVRKSTTSPTISALLIPSKFARNLHYEVVRSFIYIYRMELLDIEVYDVVVPLHLHESLEDGPHPIHTVSGRSGDQGTKKMYTATFFFVPWLPSILCSPEIFFIVHRGHLDRPIST